MLTFVVTDGFEDTISMYLDHWGGPADICRVTTYRAIAQDLAVDAGILVFSDIERLSSAGRRFADAVAEVVTLVRPDMPILNDPREVLTRYDLLATLHDRGLNDVTVRRLSDRSRADAFPVFLRYEDEHTRPLSGPLADERALAQAVLSAWLKGHDLSRLLVVGFVDVSNDEGRYHRYGTFVVGDAIIARLYHTSPDWVVKGQGVFDAAVEPATMAFVRENPHVDALRPIFDVAGISWGRVDYAVTDGTLHIWEINTNPIVMRDPSTEEPHTLERQRLFGERLTRQLRTMAAAAPDGPPVDLTAAAGPAAAVLAEPPRPRTTTRIRRWGQANRTWLGPIVDGIATASGPAAEPIADAAVSRASREH